MRSVRLRGPDGGPAILTGRDVFFLRLTIVVFGRRRGREEAAGVGQDSCEGEEGALRGGDFSVSNQSLAFMMQSEAFRVSSFIFLGSQI